MSSYHSITFGDKNTWDDWHLVPSSRPVFSPPALKKRSLEIPGASGSLDLTEMPSGYPTFENREGSIEFYVINDPDDVHELWRKKDYGLWYDRYSTIMAYLHGQRMKAIIEDDRRYYYIGRFTVNEWRSEKDYSKIVIDYDLEPYKWSVSTSTEAWLWDPFNFDRDKVPQETDFKNIKVDNSKWTTKRYTQAQFGRAPTCPTIITDKDIKVRFSNTDLGLNLTSFTVKAGKTYLSRCVMYGRLVTFDLKTVTGDAKVSIDFREGQL